MLTPREGSVFIDGWDICAASQKARDAFRIQNIGYIFQDFKLLEDMRVSDNIGILKLENIDTGDVLLLLIVLYLLVEGDDLELVIALGLVLLMGLGEKGEEERGQALPGEGPE